MRRFVISVLISAALASGGVIGIAEQGGFLHIDGQPVTHFDRFSLSYFSTLGSENLGGFGWSYTNLTGAPQTDVRFLAFVDADLDRDINTFVNEYGALVNLSLPPGAPLGSVAASSWEIDEPGSYLAISIRI